MTCLNPKPVKFHWAKIISKKTGEIKPAKIAKFLGYTQEPTIETDYIPCGKCIGCKVDKANDWATRAYLQSLENASNCFLTLTYDNEHLPKPKSLVKRDLQLFFKRLRKSIYPQKIQYLACGEYGSITRRPHYHIALFNYWPDDAKQFKKNENNDILFTSETLQKIWGKGFIIIGNLTYQSAAYIARYVAKKAFGADEITLKLNQQPEFITASKRPAIAKNFYFDQQKWQKILRNNGIIISTNTGISIKKIPQYLLEKWKLYDHNSYYQWKYIQKQKNIQNEQEKLSKTDKNFLILRQDQRKLKEQKLKRLDKYRQKNIDLS